MGGSVSAYGRRSNGRGVKGVWWNAGQTEVHFNHCHICLIAMGQGFYNMEHACSVFFFALELEKVLLKFSHILLKTQRSIL